MPILIFPAIETISNTSKSAIQTFEASTCDNLHTCRTIWNILWSCIITLFACIWLSIHMNIPDPEDRRGTKFARRVWIMVLALIVPELIVGWAARQQKAALDIVKKNKKYGWTMTHGFFVVMGGFMECDEDGNPVRTILKEDEIPAEVKKRISEVEIQDKGKGDILSKGFALLQTGWFILQCISRKIDGLPVTQLEIATVAFAALNFATYILWWNKPLNAGQPVRVFRTRLDPGRDETQNAAFEAEAQGLVRTLKGRKAWLWTTCKKLWLRFKGMLRGFKRGLVDFLKEVHRPIAAEVKQYGWHLIWLFPILPYVPVTRGSSLGSNARRVGTFSPESVSLEYSGLMMVVVPVVGILFGGIHCIAWAFQFPSRPEQLLWRISAISVTSAPLSIVFAWKFTAANSDGTGLLKALKTWLFGFLFILSILLYVVARLTLLVLPFMSLRSLPPGAYRTADWTRFIPHV